MKILVDNGHGVDTPGTHRPASFRTPVAVRDGTLHQQRQRADVQTYGNNNL